jgi:hypothetical protein
MIDTMSWGNCSTNRTEGDLDISKRLLLVHGVLLRGLPVTSSYLESLLVVEAGVGLLDLGDCNTC